MSDYLRELIVLIGTPIAVMIVLVFVGRKLLASVSQRDLLKLKADLEAARIERGSLLLTIRSRRAEVIAEFYELLSNAYHETDSLVNVVEVSGGPTTQEARWRRATDACEAARDYFRRRRLYFDAPTCQTVDEIFAALQRGHIDFGLSQDSDPRERHEKWVQADAAMKKVVPKALDQLAEAFRQAIGAQG